MRSAVAESPWPLPSSDGCDGADGAADEERDQRRRRASRRSPCRGGGCSSGRCARPTRGSGCALEGGHGREHRRARAGAPCGRPASSTGGNPTHLKGSSGLDRWAGLRAGSPAHADTVNSCQATLRSVPRGRSLREPAHGSAHRPRHRPGHHRAPTTHPPRAGAMDPGFVEVRDTTPFVERTPVRSPFPPIADYAFLSDCHTGALVAPDGTIEWLCPPRFDSPSASSPRSSTAPPAASASARRAMGVPAGRRYEPGTNILETTWMTPTGWMIVRDALVIGRWRERTQGSTTAHTRPPTDYDAHHVLVRTVTCIHGQAQIELLCEPMFDYGRVPATWSLSRRPVRLRRHRRRPPRCGCCPTSTSASRAASPARATASRTARRASARSRGRACSTARAPPRRPRPR